MAPYQKKRLPTWEKAVYSRLLILISLFVASASLHSPAAVAAESALRVYYVRTDGHDACQGTTNAPDALPGSDACAFRTIAQALQQVQPGDTISVLPGIYRETIVPQTSGTASQPITIKAENGPNTVYFYASESTADKLWNPYADYTAVGGGLNLQPGVNPNDIRYIDLDWCYTQDPQSAALRFYDRCSDVLQGDVPIPFETDLVALVNNEGTPERSVTPLPKAQEPDWQIDVSWKVSENWWKADSGATSLADGGFAASPAPRTTSQHFLKDTQDDNTLDEDLDNQPDFPHIPPGNIRDLFAADDFTDPREAIAPSPSETMPQFAGQTKKVSLGATIIFNDTQDGHYTDNLFIQDYNAETGVIAIQDVYNPEEYEKLGYLTKFYVEGTPKAMDCPGEWVHHDGKLFVLLGTGCGRSVTEADLPHLEVAKQFELLRLDSISHITLQNINFAFGNSNRYGAALYLEAWAGGPPRYVGAPMTLLSLAADGAQNSGAAAEVVLDGIVVADSMTGLSFVGRAQLSEPTALTLRNSTFQNIADRAIDIDNRGEMRLLVLENNIFRNLAFHPLSGEADGLHLQQVSNVIFRHNLVQSIGHNGVQFFQGNEAFVANNILIEGNTFDAACQMATDCAGLKLHGGGKSYGDVLVIDNVSQNNLGWTYARWRRDLARSNPEVGNETTWYFTQLGLMANGYYLDFSSGITFYQNWAINNGRAGIYLYPTYRDGKIYILHNTLVGALNGIYFYPGHQFRNQPLFANHSLDHHDTRVVGNLISGYENAGIYISCSQSDMVVDDDGNVHTPPQLNMLNVVLDYNIFQELAANPNPDPYWWYDPATYHPVDVQYHACNDIMHNYEDVSVLQTLTPWQAHGVDWDATGKLYVNEGGNGRDDYLPADTSAVTAIIGAAVPTEVTGLINSLQAALGVTVDRPFSVTPSPTLETPTVTSIPGVVSPQSPNATQSPGAAEVAVVTPTAEPTTITNGGPLSRIPVLRRLAGKPVLQTVVGLGVLIILVGGIGFIIQIRKRNR